MLPAEFVGLGSRVSEDFLLLCNWIPQDACTISISKVLLRPCGVFSKLEARNPFAGGGINDIQPVQCWCLHIVQTLLIEHQCPPAVTTWQPQPCLFLCQCSDYNVDHQVIRYYLEFSYELLVFVSLIILK